jgi:xanthine dehydrogenase accessory factor
VVNPCLSGGALEIFLDPQVPAPLVDVFGGSPIADAVVEVGTLLGYDIRRLETPDPAALDGVTALVIASLGGPETDLIRAALDRGVGYIGLVASRSRGSAMLDGLDLTGPERARVHTPVGLDIGARTPAEIAVSIAAEVIATVRGVAHGR